MAEEPKPPLRDAQMMLDDAIDTTIERAFKEWDLTVYDVVGVLTVIAARYAHMSCVHEGDDE